MPKHNLFKPLETQSPKVGNSLLNSRACIFATKVFETHPCLWHSDSNCSLLASRLCGWLCSAGRILVSPVSFFCPLLFLSEYLCPLLLQWKGLSDWQPSPLKRQACFPPPLLLPFSSPCPLLLWDTPFFKGSIFSFCLLLPVVSFFFFFFLKLP